MPAHVIELLAWLVERRRSYAETIDAWRTACPRLAAWEDAFALRLIELDGARRDAEVRLTAAGAEALAQALA
ncbi:MAG TPA: hypothetical protein VG248_09510 [Caulobacteraceae bacterium]|jgi:hypothetical protein|nr:hypothetical protein [Caulobacteraceae bacterium]